MAKNNINSKKGFTIIEVVLVLAIAGLIFLMVFVALPSLQRSQRDTQRRSDMARLATALTNWQTNHNNNLPGSSDATTLLNDYLKSNDGEFKDPQKNDKYTITIAAATSTGTLAAGDNPEIKLYTNAYCNNGTPTYKAGNNNYAIVYKLEGSGIICQDN